MSVEIPVVHVILEPAVVAELGNAPATPSSRRPLFTVCCACVYVWFCVPRSLLHLIRRRRRWRELVLPGVSKDLCVIIIIVFLLREKHWCLSNLLRRQRGNQQLLCIHDNAHFLLVGLRARIVQLKLNIGWWPISLDKHWPLTMTLVAGAFVLHSVNV